jgi:hypothetical protein
MSVVEKVRDEIAGFSQKFLFTTLHLLHCGSRNAVDKALAKLVNESKIKRLARGVFLAIGNNMQIPSVWEIAQAKARRFGKRLARQNGIMDDSGAAIFATDGCTSTFSSVHGQIRFEHKAASKLDLAAEERQKIHPEQSSQQYSSAQIRAGYPGANLAFYWLISEFGRSLNKIQEALAGRELSARKRQASLLNYSMPLNRIIFSATGYYSSQMRN